MLRHLYFRQARQASFRTFCSDPDFQSKTKEFDNTEVYKQFDKWINDNDIVLFMKGTKKMP